MKRDTKQLIIKTAYYLFLEKGYDAVSIRMIQEAAGIGKATMYHYFTGKQALFEAVIQVNFEVARAENNIDSSQLLVSEYIEETISKARYAMAHSPLPKNIGMLNFFIMNFQAIELNPNLALIGHEIHEGEVNRWKTYIQNSMDSGELKETTDVEKTARLFINVRHGIGVTSTHQTAMAENIDAIEEMYNYIYTLVKK